MKTPSLTRVSTIAAHIGTALVVTGCGSATLIVDDGRKLDASVINEVRTYRSAATDLRPAIVKSAALNDKDCSKQFELPFEASSSYFFKDKNVKIAMVRELGMNEFLTVLAADPDSGIAAGDVISEVDGYHSSNTLKMKTELLEARNSGHPFKLKFTSGKQVSVTPLKVCRGYVVPAFPPDITKQYYHWTGSVHPQEVFKRSLTPDEAEWVVLWTQGLSEVGGARMKTYSYFIGGIQAIAYVGITIATAGASVAAGGAAAAAGASAGAAYGQVAITAAAGEVVKVAAMATSNTASLSGVSHIAAGVFDKADAWAFENMKRLGMNPRAGVSLNAKLAEQGAGHNAFVLDEERLAKMQTLIAQLPPEVPLVQGYSVEGAQAVPDASIEATGLSSMSTSAALSDPTADSAKVQEIDIRNLPAE